MKSFVHILFSTCFCLIFSLAAFADQKVPDWGNAGTFSVVGVHVTNTGVTVVSGNTGSAYAATGFDSGFGTVVNGRLISAVDFTNQKTADYQTIEATAVASSDLASDILNTPYYSTSTDLTGRELGTAVNNLKPGIYTFSSDAALAGTLTLDDGGDKNALYIFRIEGGLSTGAGSVIQMKSRGSGLNIFWTASRNTTIGAGSVFRGNIVGQNNEGKSYGSDILVSKGASVSGKVCTVSGNISFNTNNIALVMDTDGDGLADGLDDYPNDPTRALNQLSTVSTIAFEDQWPSSGDYDMNDVVLNFSYNIITNESNNVVQVLGTYVLMATGGVQPNSFGIEFPIQATNVGTIQSGKMEAGQAKAVFILYKNMRTEMANWNTIPGKPFSQPVTYTVNFMLKDLVSIADFKLDGYNPFIFNILEGKRQEIHLPGLQPTTLADQSLFGKGIDVTVPGTKSTYISKNGRSWAIVLPIPDFDYPVETMAITKGFTHFLDWAVNGGAVYPDWFTNDKAKTSSSGGYRSPSFIYSTYLPKN